MTTISHTRLSFVVPLVGVCCLTLDGKTTLHFVSGNGRAAIVTAAKALFVLCVHVGLMMPMWLRSCVNLCVWFMLDWSRCENRLPLTVPCSVITVAFHSKDWRQRWEVLDPWPPFSTWLCCCACTCNVCISPPHSPISALFAACSYICTLLGAAAEPDVALRFGPWDCTFGNILLA